MRKAKQQAIICDIDGTIAIHDTAVRSPYDHAKSHLDKPQVQIIDLLQLVNLGDNCSNDHNGGEIQIILVSGRKEQFRAITEEWLRKHLVPWGILLMRKDNDNRSDAIIKREIYDAEIKDKYKVLFVLDDRQRVVDMWRKELGLVCLQVNYGNF